MNIFNKTRNYTDSKKWKYWKVIMDDRLCLQCYEKYGTIYSIGGIL